MVLSTRPDLRPAYIPKVLATYTRFFLVAIPRNFSHPFSVIFRRVKFFFISGHGHTGAVNLE